MNEEAVRAIIREAIARHLDGERVGPGAPQPMILAKHASHHRYTLPESGGPCLIEPAVQCNHCGYCESHGH